MGEPIFSEEWKDAIQNLPTLWAYKFALTLGGRAPFCLAPTLLKVPRLLVPPMSKDWV
jgi:hypothetical protein